jgi:hypothetical protein
LFSGLLMIKQVECRHGHSFRMVSFLASR